MKKKKLWLTILSLMLALLCPVAKTQAHHGEGNGHHGHGHYSYIETEALTTGTTITDQKTNAKYKVTSSQKGSCCVQYLKPLVKKTSVTVPSSITVDGCTYSVTSIAKNAFKNQTNLKKVTVGCNVVSIGSGAFYGCKGLTVVKLGKNVTSIGNNAFCNCKKLSKITLPANVDTIGSKTFYGCSHLKSVSIQCKKLKSVGSNAFGGISSQAVIKVPKGKQKTWHHMLNTKTGCKNTMKIKGCH